MQIKVTNRGTAEMLKEKTYLTAEQAKKLDLVDEVINYIK